MSDQPTATPYKAAETPTTTAPYTPNVPTPSATAAATPGASPVLPTATPTPLPTPTPTPASTPAPTRVPMPKGLGDQDAALWRIGEKVPPFGGLFLYGSTLKIYLLDPKDEKALADAVEAIKAEYGRLPLETRDIQPIQGQFRVQDLLLWRQQIGYPRGVGTSDMNEGQNRVVVYMNAIRNGERDLRAGLTERGIPQDAVVVVVGAQNTQSGSCAVREPRADARAVSEWLQVTLTAPASVDSAGTVPLKMTVKNASQAPLSFRYGATPFTDFVVETAQGTHIWRQECPWYGFEGAPVTYAPGEEHSFTAEWELVDDLGKPVPPGTYLIHGLLSVDVGGNTTLVQTQPGVVVVLPTPTPTPRSLAPFLLEVQPPPGTVVHFDSQGSATLDISPSGLGKDYRGRMWASIAGAETTTGITTVDNRDSPTRGTAPIGSIKNALEYGSLKMAPPLKSGPIELQVRYQDREGREIKYAWTVYLDLSAPDLPADVTRVRDTYGLVEKARALDPGIAGHYLDLKRDALEVYLADGADPRAAEDALNQVFTSEKRPTGGIIVITPHVTFPDGDVYRRVNVAVTGAGTSIHSAWQDTRHNRISFEVESPEDVHKSYAALAEAGLPREAVVFSVAPKRSLNSLPVQQVASNGVAISVEFSPTMQQGMAYPFRILLTNTTDQLVEFEHNGFEWLFLGNIWMYTTDGQYVWDWMGGGGMLPVGGSTRLAPGESRILGKWWTVADRDGFAVPPGRYLVRAEVDINLPAGDRMQSVTLATPPLELIVAGHD